VRGGNKDFLTMWNEISVFVLYFRSYSIYYGGVKGDQGFQPQVIEPWIAG
jgi:hypothetical protein